MSYIYDLYQNDSLYGQEKINNSLLDVYEINYSICFYSPLCVLQSMIERLSFIYNNKMYYAVGTVDLLIMNTLRAYSGYYALKTALSPIFLSGNNYITKVSTYLPSVYDKMGMNKLILTVGSLSGIALTYITSLGTALNPLKMDYLSITNVKQILSSKHITKYVKNTNELMKMLGGNTYLSLLLSGSTTTLTSTSSILTDLLSCCTISPYYLAALSPTGMAMITKSAISSSVSIGTSVLSILPTIAMGVGTLAAGLLIANRGSQMLENLTGDMLNNVSWLAESTNMPNTTIITVYDQVIIDNFIIQIQQFMNDSGKQKTADIYLFNEHDTYSFSKVNNCDEMLHYNTIAAMVLYPQTKSYVKNNLCFTVEQKQLQNTIITPITIAVNSMDFMSFLHNVECVLSNKLTNSVTQSLIQTNHQVTFNFRNIEYQINIKIPIVSLMDENDSVKERDSFDDFPTVACVFKICLPDEINAEFVKQNPGSLNTLGIDVNNSQKDAYNSFANLMYSNQNLSQLPLSSQAQQSDSLQSSQSPSFSSNVSTLTDNTYNSSPVSLTSQFTSDISDNTQPSSTINTLDNTNNTQQTSTNNTNNTQPSATNNTNNTQPSATSTTTNTFNDNRPSLATNNNMTGGANKIPKSMNVVYEYCVNTVLNSYSNKIPCLLDAYNLYELDYFNYADKNEITNTTIMMTKQLNDQYNKVYDTPNHIEVFKLINNITRSEYVALSALIENNLGISIDYVATSSEKVLDTQKRLTEMSKKSKDTMTLLKQRASNISTYLGSIIGLNDDKGKVIPDSNATKVKEMIEGMVKVSKDQTTKASLNLLSTVTGKDEKETLKLSEIITKSIKDAFSTVTNITKEVTKSTGFVVSKMGELAGKYAISVLQGNPESEKDQLELKKSYLRELSIILEILNVSYKTSIYLNIVIKELIENMKELNNEIEKYTRGALNYKDTTNNKIIIDTLQNLLNKIGRDLSNAIFVLSTKYKSEYSDEFINLFVNLINNWITDAQKINPDVKFQMLTLDNFKAFDLDAVNANNKGIADFETINKDLFEKIQRTKEEMKNMFNNSMTGGEGTPNASSDTFSILNIGYDEEELKRLLNELKAYDGNSYSTKTDVLLINNKYLINQILKKFEDMDLNAVSILYSDGTKLLNDVTTKMKVISNSDLTNVYELSDLFKNTIDKTKYNKNIDKVDMMHIYNKIYGYSYQYVNHITLQEYYDQNIKNKSIIMTTDDDVLIAMNNYICALIQVYHCLEDLNDDIYFVHGELNLSNILLYSPFDKDYYINFNHYDKTGKITTYRGQYIAKIKDYSSAFIQQKAGLNNVLGTSSVLTSNSNLLYGFLKQKTQFNTFDALMACGVTFEPSGNQSIIQTKTTLGNDVRKLISNPLGSVSSTLERLSNTAGNVSEMANVFSQLIGFKGNKENTKNIAEEIKKTDYIYSVEFFANNDNTNVFLKENNLENLMDKYCKHVSSMAFKSSMLTKQNKSVETNKLLSAITGTTYDYAIVTNLCEFYRNMDMLPMSFSETVDVLNKCNECLNRTKNGLNKNDDLLGQFIEPFSANVMQYGLMPKETQVFVPLSSENSFVDAQVFDNTYLLTYRGTTKKATAPAVLDCLGKAHDIINAVLKMNMTDNKNIGVFSFGNGQTINYQTNPYSTAIMSSYVDPKAEALRQQLLYMTAKQSMLEDKNTVINMETLYSMVNDVVTEQVNMMKKTKNNPMLIDNKLLSQARTQVTPQNNLQLQNQTQTQTQMSMQQQIQNVSTNKNSWWSTVKDALGIKTGGGLYDNTNEDTSLELFADQIMKSDIVISLESPVGNIKNIFNIPVKGMNRMVNYNVLQQTIYEGGCYQNIDTMDNSSKCSNIITEIKDVSGIPKSTKDMMEYFTLSSDYIKNVPKMSENNVVQGRDIILSVFSKNKKLTKKLDFMKMIGELNRGNKLIYLSEPMLSAALFNYYFVGLSKNENGEPVPSYLLLKKQQMNNLTRKSNDAVINDRLHVNVEFIRENNIKGYACLTLPYYDARLSNVNRSNNIFYEYYIGKYVINNMVPYYPNFVQTYNMVLFETDVEMKKLCENVNNMPTNTQFSSDARYQTQLDTRLFVNGDGNYTGKNISGYWGMSCQYSNRVGIFTESYAQFPTLQEVLEKDVEMIQKLVNSNVNKSLDDKIQKLKDKLYVDMVGYLFQIYKALYAVKGGFSHNNLTLNNVRMYKPVSDDNIITIRYLESSLQNKKVSNFYVGQSTANPAIQTQYIPKITNYEMAYINVKMSDENNNYYNETTQTIIDNSGVLNKCPKLSTNMHSSMSITDYSMIYERSTNNPTSDVYLMYLLSNYVMQNKMTPNNGQNEGFFDKAAKYILGVKQNNKDGVIYMGQFTRELINASNIKDSENKLSTVTETFMYLRQIITTKQYYNLAKTIYNDKSTAATMYIYDKYEPYEIEYNDTNLKNTMNGILVEEKPNK